MKKLGKARRNAFKAKQTQAKVVQSEAKRNETNFLSYNLSEVKSKAFFGKHYHSSNIEIWSSFSKGRD